MEEEDGRGRGKRAGVERMRRKVVKEGRKES